MAIIATQFHHPSAPVSNAQIPTSIEQNASVDAQDKVPFKLTEQRRIHILYGDGTGGGHKAGAGKPGKTEFPANWNEDKIISTITHIANDNHLPMRQSGRRYWLRMGEQDGLQIRVVLDKEHREIITGYPVESHRN
ncbi:MAG: EndoU domain-containing protein [Alphaproteobacteria bacterium]|nr:EndoU domain-containing protein [Alphaproteobacteria bacterium]